MSSEVEEVVEVEIRDRIRELRRVKAAELVPNPKNWRRHPKEQALALKGLLSEIGFADALLARQLADGRLMLIDGHLRAETSKQATIPVLVLDVNEQEADKILLTLDPLAGMAQADKAQVEALLSGVRTESVAVGELLERIAGEQAWQAVNQPSELLDPEPHIDRAAALQAKWATARGQLWQIGPHRVLCADGRETSSLERLCDDDRPKLMVTDPPYGVEYDPAWRDQIAGGAKRPRALGRVTNDDCDDWTSVYRDSGCDVVYLWHASLHAVQFAQSLIRAGFDLRCQIVWAKAHFVISRGHYHWQHEPCWYAVRKGAVAQWGGDRTQSSLWQISGLNPFGGQRQQTDEPSGHCAQKPIECMARPIRNHQFPSVYDPFCGSGSTLIAAHQLGRIGFGIEIEPAYVAVTLERLATLGLKPELV